MREQCQQDMPAERLRRATELWPEEQTSPAPLYDPQPWGPITDNGAFSFGPIALDYGTDGFVPDQILSDDADQWHDSPADHGVFHQTTVKLPTQFEAMCGNLSARYLLIIIPSNVSIKISCKISKPSLPRGLRL